MRNQRGIAGAIADLLDGWPSDGAPAPVAAWVAFAAGGCDEDQIREKLTGAGERLSQPDDRAASRAIAAHQSSAALQPPAGLHGIRRPERVALLRSWRKGTAAPAWALEAARTGLPDGGWEALRARADHAAVRLAALPPPASSGSRDVAAAITAYLDSGVPGLLLEDTQEGSACVEAIETALVLSVARTPPVLRTPGSEFDRFVSGWVEPVRVAGGPAADNLPASAVPEFIQMLARLDLAGVWWGIGREPGDAAQGAGQTNIMNRLLRLLRAAVARLADQSTTSFSGVMQIGFVPEEASAIGESAAWQPAAAVGTDALARALTGTITVGESPDPAEAVWRIHAPWQASGLADAGRVEMAVSVDAGQPDPRLRFLAETRLFVEPEVLTSRGLPESVFTETLDTGSVLLTGLLSAASLRVWEDGRTEQQPAWPRPIVAETAWGPDGSRLAWTRPDNGWLMWRTADSPRVFEERAPCVIERVFPVGDGSAWIAGWQGGLWRWRPGGTFEHVADVPAPIWIERTADGWRIDSCLRTPDDRVTRQVASHAALLDVVHRSTRPVALDHRGAISYRAARDGWTGTAYPHADVVVLTHADGRVAHLACYFPWCLSWMGRSLLVCLWTGEVLLFRGLLDTVEHAPRDAA